MDTSGQFALFGLCIAVGFLGGVLYEGFAFFRLLLGSGQGKSKIVGGVLDIAFWLAFALFTIWSGYFFKFPSFRVYIWMGYVVGGIIYLKTLHKIIAFFESLCYNKIAKLVKWARKKEKTLINRWKKAYDARKNEKNNHGNRRSGDDTPRRFARLSHLSVDNNRSAQQSYRKGGRGRRLLRNVKRAE